MAITAVPAAPTAAEDAVAITVTGLETNDPATYDAGTYPTETENRYYLKAVAPAGSTPAQDLVSEVWSCDQDGEKVLLPWVFPVAGEWTLRVQKAADDSIAQSQALTVA